MDRRRFLTVVATGAAAATFAPRAFAHHGWRSFDEQTPLYLEGAAREVRWQNPHAELRLVVDDRLAVPASLAKLAPPPQRTAVDGAAILAAARPPRRRGEWNVELAPLTRMAQWNVPRIEDGQRIAVVGYTFPREEGEQILRAEYLVLGDAVYGLRSSPA